MECSRRSAGSEMLLWKGASNTSPPRRTDRTLASCDCAPGGLRRRPRRAWESHRGLRIAALRRAGKLVSFYWMGAMIGRSVGSALLIRLPAARLLTVFTESKHGVLRAHARLHRAVRVCVRSRARASERGRSACPRACALRNQRPDASGKSYTMIDSMRMGTFSSFSGPCGMSPRNESESPGCRRKLSVPCR